MSRVGRQEKQLKTAEVSGRRVDQFYENVDNVLHCEATQPPRRPVHAPLMCFPTPTATASAIPLHEFVHLHLITSGGFGGLSGKTEAVVYS